MNYLTEEDISYLRNDKICFKIYAFEILPKKEIRPIPSKEAILRNHLEVKFEGENEAQGDDDEIQRYHSVQIGNPKNKKGCIIF